MALATKTSRLVSKSSNKYALKIDTLLLLADCGPDYPAPRKVLEIRALIRRATLQLLQVLFGTRKS